MGTVVFTFGSLDLSDIVERTWEESLDTRINAELVPKRHGALVNEVPVLGPRLFRTEGTVVQDATSLQTKLENLRRDLKRQGRAKLKIFSDRFIMARNTALRHDYVDGSGMVAARFYAEFFADDPFFYDNANDPALVEATLDANPKSITVSLQGSNAFTYPVIQISAVGANISGPITILNVEQGNQFTYSGVVTSGTLVEFDFSAFTLKNNGADDWAKFSGRFIVLDPEKGANNTIRVSGTSGSHIAKIYYSPRYY